MATKRKPKKFTPKEVMIHGRELWQIYIGSEVRKRPDGREVRVPMRKTFADRNEANQYAELLRIQRTNHGSQAMTISARLRSEAIEADALLRPFGISVLEAAKEIATRQAALSASRNTADAIRDYIQSAINDGRAKRYIEDLQSRLGRFAQGFGNTPLAGITTSDIDNWLQGLGLGAVSRNSYRRRLVALFNYGIDRGWCPGNPARKTTIAKENPAPIGILTPDEFARLLGAANEITLPYHLLAGFAGIRSAELGRLEWKDIHWDSGLIEVSAGKSKTAARRFIHMQPALSSWVVPYRNHRGPICPVANATLRKLLEKDRCRAGITTWPNNALRHSFASYYLATFKNPSELSLEMGHTSPGLLFRHYRELVTPDAAAKWWSIMPAAACNVLEIA